MAQALIPSSLRWPVFRPAPAAVVPPRLHVADLMDKMLDQPLGPNPSPAVAHLDFRLAQVDRVGIGGGREMVRYATELPNARYGELGEDVLFTLGD